MIKGGGVKGLSGYKIKTEGVLSQSSLSKSFTFVDLLKFHVRDVKFLTFQVISTGFAGLCKKLTMVQKIQLI